MTTPDTLKKTTNVIRNFATLKISSIGILVIVLLIPTSMISSLMKERQARRNSVVKEINQKWGNSQTITGPFFTVPYKSFYKGKNDKIQYNICYLHILPVKLEISGEINPKVRYRSIYETVLYNIRLNLNGNFIIPTFKQLNIDLENVLWNQAVFSIGITDMRGIKENIVIKFNGIEYKASPGLKTTDIALSGVTSVIPLSFEGKNNFFTFQLNLNGSELIHFTPVAESTNVNITSNWPSPSFNGSFLPTKRKINEKGFSADWKILHLNRNYPQYWTGNRHKVNQSSFGLKLLITANVYQKSMRIAKYAIMFIIFTFAAFFLSEIINKNRVHPIQYFLIGLGIILFYVLLLSISEHISFNSAYLLSALAITFLITGYSQGILKSYYFTFTLFGILAVLYFYLYIVLQLEDYALIMGSIGLLFVLSTVMYVTRKIDWYSLNDTHSKDKI